MVDPGPEVITERFDPKAVSWEHGFTPVRYESETNERFMSESRNKLVRQAIYDRKEPESLQLGKMLRKSHITLSMTKDRAPAQTEAQQRWTKQPIEMSKSFADVRIAELRKANIDLSVGEPKTGKGWISDQTACMSANEDVKFACKKPQGFAELGAELRKSSVLLHAGRHDFRSPGVPVPRTEAMDQWTTKPIEVAESFSGSLGKELRTSSFDYSYGVSKSGAHWQSQQHSVMANQNDQKWACHKQKGFDNLIAELRKTNITLGSDPTVYGTQGNTRPVRDDRKKRAAGVARGL